MKPAVKDWVILLDSNSGAMAGVTNEALRLQMGERYSGQACATYAKPPVVKSIFPGRSTVQVELRGYLEGANSL